MKVVRTVLCAVALSACTTPDPKPTMTPRHAYEQAARGDGPDWMRSLIWVYAQH